ncbi:MAG: hypothetical protein AABZ15_13460 [Nitrospirota bacterium]
MNTLFFSFFIAIGGAIGLVTLSKSFDLENFTTRIFPIIPILYAIVYETLERRKRGKGVKTIPPSQAKEEMKAGAVAIFQNITVERIIIIVGVSLLIKTGLEIISTGVYLSAGRMSFEEVYGPFGIETIGRFLRGDHPWLAGNQGIMLLALIALITGLGTGLWIGTTTKALPVLEGVIAGAAVTVLSTMTNMLVLYRTIENLAKQSAESFGYVFHAGFAVVITLQVLLYGLWSGMANRAMLKREALRTEKKARKSKK